MKEEFKEMKQDLNLKQEEFKREMHEELQTNLDKIKQSAESMDARLNLMMTKGEAEQLITEKVQGTVKEEWDKLVAASGSVGPAMGWSGAGQRLGGNVEVKEKMKREMIITHFQKDTAREAIIGAIRGQVGRTGLVAEDVFCFGPFGSSGVVRFRSGEEKGLFKEWLRDHRMETDVGALSREGRNEIFANDNQTKETRMRRKHAAIVKQGIGERKGDYREVKVWYQQLKVYYKGKEVAHWYGDQMVVPAGGGVDDCLPKITALLKEWKEKMVDNGEDAT